MNLHQLYRYRLLQRGRTPAAADADDCWRQAAVRYLGRFRPGRRPVIIDRRDLTPFSSLNGQFSLKIRAKSPGGWRCSGARIIGRRTDEGGITTVKVQPEPDRPEIRTDIA